MFCESFFSVNSVEKVKKNLRIHASVKGADYIIIMLVQLRLFISTVSCKHF